MSLSYSERRKAIQYNRQQGLDEKLIKKIQTHTGTKDDGDIGPRTVDAVALWRQANGLKPDGKIGPKTLKELEKGLPTKETGNKQPQSFLVEPEEGFEPTIIDRRVEGGKALRRKSLDTNRKFQDPPRSAERIDGIVMHQMGFSRGDDVRKYDKVTAHFIVTQAGEYSPAYLTPRQVAAGRYLLKHVKETYKINKVFAHRQATGPMRTNCCGPEIWRSIAEYAIAPDGPGFEDTAGATFGNGTPIPDSWRK